MKISELLSETTFGGQDVEGNALTQFKDKFPNLSTIAYFIPGFGQALLAADLASQVQMYNQAIAKIEQKYPQQTIQTVQQKVGDTDEVWEPLNEFAPSSDDDGDEDLLFKYAKMWYNGDNHVQHKIEKILDRAGWEIGELESEEGGAFVIQSGDEHGDTYIGWSAHDLENT